MPKDPFVDFISTLADKIRIEKEHRAMMQKINSSETPIIENKASLETVLSTIQDKIVQEIKKTDPVATEVIPVSSETVTEEDADNFGDFVSRLKGILGGEQRMPAKSSEPLPAIIENDAEDKSVASTQEIIAPVAESRPIVAPPVKETKKIKAKKPADAKKEYLEVLEQLSGSVAEEQESAKITDIKKLFEEYAEKYIKKAMTMAEYAGGGGTNAVQYANGGTMNGDLNVTGNYLSAGINLLDIFTAGGSDDLAVNAVVRANSGQWDDAYTNLVANSAVYLLSGTDVNLGNIPVLSAGWNSNYTTTNSNSANWTAAYSNLINNSAAYLSGFDLSLIAAASGSWNSNYTTTNSNSAFWADTRYNVTFGQDVTINGNLTALGSSTFKNTIFTTTSALSVINIGPGPALYVFQAAGPSDVASFYDGDGIEVLHVGNAQPGGKGFVGINESFPATELTVSGQISANNDITVLGGNSNQWNSNYSITQSNSASWSSAYTTLCSTSAFRISNTITSVLFPNGYAFSNSDTGKTYHVDTRSAPVSVLLPSNLTDDFSVTLVTLGTNNMHVSSSQVPVLCATGTKVNLAFASTFIYKYDNLLWGLGSLI